MTGMYQCFCKDNASYFTLFKNFSDKFNCGSFFYLEFVGGN
jgi:hypothetical protein